MAARPALAAPEFFGCRGSARAPEFSLEHLPQFCVPPLISSNTIKTNRNTHGRKNSFL